MFNTKLGGEDLEIRYTNKNYLVQYELDIELFKSFGLNVIDVVPLRGVFLVFTESEKKLLKKMDISKDKIYFINQCLDYIRKKYGNLMTFHKTVDGMLYKECNGDIYCVMDIIDGRECEVANPVDLQIASENLAHMHKSGEGIVSYMAYEHHNILRDNIKLKGAIDKFYRNIDSLNSYKQWVTKYIYKNEFDNIFLEYVDMYIGEIKESIALLKSYGYEKICGEKDKVTFCHGDLAHHNILIKDEEAYFIDFDYSAVDLKVVDLATFINKTVKLFEYDINMAKNIIDSYEKVNPLMDDEKGILYALLRYPHDFYQISRDYYEKRKLWDYNVFLDRLVKKVNYKEEREEFLKELKGFI